MGIRSFGTEIRGPSKGYRSLGKVGINKWRQKRPWINTECAYTHCVILRARERDLRAGHDFGLKDWCKSGIGTSLLIASVLVSLFEVRDEGSLIRNAESRCKEENIWIIQFDEGRFDRNENSLQSFGGSNKRWQALCSKSPLIPRWLKRWYFGKNNR